jgi:hypothetical protein
VAVDSTVDGALDIDGNALGAAEVTLEGNIDGPVLGFKDGAVLGFKEGELLGVFEKSL